MKSFVEQEYILDDIIRKIENRTFEPGERLPSENVLAAGYDVSRTVIHALYENLAALEIIYSKQGKGWYVKEKPVKIQYRLTDTGSFTEKLQKMNIEPVTRAVELKTVSYKEHIFTELGAAAGETVYKLIRVRYINGQPIAIYNSYLKKRDFPDIEQEWHDITSIFQYFKKCRYTIVESDKESVIRIRIPKEYERQLLNCSRFEPLVILYTCNKTGRTACLEYCITKYRSDYFDFIIK
ncbi:MAG: GntR family transcriptional regulator [Treponema sp.]|nr:GntR family transcriptional regulator [Treponema sp.]